jgi:DNA invertase Pin-like site-specific DNA recombinase
MSESKQPFSREEIIKTVTEEISKIRTGGVYAIYSRLSHFDENAQGYSIEIQPDRSEEFARSENASEIRAYSDPGRSGKNSKRPELQRMIRDIKAGRIDVVVFHRVDRVFRNLKSLLEFVDLLKKHNVRLVSVTEQIDTDTWWGRLVLAVLGSLAEAYLWQTSANITEALGKRRAKGNYLGRIPLGYCNGLCTTCNDENGKGYCPLYGGNDRPESKRGSIAVPHPIDRHVIPLIYDLYAENMSFREIADFLNNSAVTLPDGSQVLFRPRGPRQRNHEAN